MFAAAAKRAQSTSVSPARDTAALVRRELAKHADPVRAAFCVRYFKAGPGQYAAGDRFIGITVPIARRMANAFRTLAAAETLKLLRSPIHEERLVALFILEAQFKRGDTKRREAIVRLYLANLRHVNHWDLIDGSARDILGEHLKDRSRRILYDLAASPNLWRRRVAIISTFAFIRDGDYADTLRIARLFLTDREDLIHKASGWALREIGKRDAAVLEQFLDRHARRMPRTMLRYAIEKLSAEQRRQYLLLR